MPLQVFGGSLLLPLRIDGYTFDRVPYTGSVDERISTQLKDQLPDFVIDNYETFTQFLEAYYEWSEQYGNPRSEGSRLQSYNDVDETLDEFIQYFRDTYINDFPFEYADGINEKTLIKNVKDMYRAKGTKASFDLLFRILYNTTVSVDFPKDRILKLSTSTFDDRQFLRIAPVFSVEEAKTVENTLVIQKNPATQTINATAMIDTIDFVHQGGLDFFSLSVQDVSGVFNTESQVQMTTTGVTSASYNADVFPTLTSLVINAGGTGYEIGDRVTVNDAGGNSLLRAEIRDVGPVGQVRGFTYRENYGIYRSDTALSFVFETYGGTGASMSGESESVLSSGPDIFLDDTGLISGRSSIQDSFFFQNYSYILRVNKSLRAFADAVRNLVHPSGTLLFAEYINEVSMTGAVQMDSSVTVNVQATIGHYLPHTFGGTLDPRGFTYEGTHYDFYPTGYNGQDGRTAGDFYGTELSAAITGTPHTAPWAGITHIPNTLWSNALGGFDFPINTIESEGTLNRGALGSTDYIGLTADDEDESVGLFGFFPIGSSRISTLSNPLSYGPGVTHYGGYTSPQETRDSGGVSGGQLAQVAGDDIDADYWIVYRHPAHLGMTALGVTGSHDIVRVPLQVATTGATVESAYSSRDALGQETAILTLNGDIDYINGEIVEQNRVYESNAIGRLISYEAGSMHQGTNNPIYNVSTDALVIEVLNGKFTNDGRPIIGRDSGASRLVDPIYNGSIHTSITHETSWLDIPISVMVEDLSYNLTGN